VPTGILKNNARFSSLYCTIIIVYYNYAIKARYNYDIFHTGFLEECDKEENVAVTGTATTSCSKIRLQSFVQCHLFSQ